ncbi:uncharacterized protein LOC110825655 isoform X6 [Carica papaya]|uniref:uncharacterized protein LOC110825655 isoform X6 n=1 Tax=Carica papaya TaxID=3649 RepID=UPI000B8CE2F5|nr:uncharacterized protein LOC110825655 isoform X6 [Carica papaya]
MRNQRNKRILELDHTMVWYYELLCFRSKPANTGSLTLAGSQYSLRRALRYVSNKRGRVCTKKRTRKAEEESSYESLPHDFII